jgi:transposase
VSVCRARPAFACTRQCCRRPRCYPSDTREGEWALLSPLLPVPACQVKTGGRPEAHCRRAVVDAIRYVIHNGCVWRALPSDFPPWRTVYGFYQRWNASGVTFALHAALRARARVAAGRKAEPTAAVIDSQSVRAAATVPRASRGWDNAKKVNGRKRHIAVDATGLLLEVLITPASVQDRDAARPLLFNLTRACRRVRLAWADGGYTGKLLPWAATGLKLTVEIVRRPDDLHTFQVLPRRWVVERTLAWITSYRRCARDYERLPAHHQAAVYWAMITLMTRRLTRTS